MKDAANRWYAQEHARLAKFLGSEDLALEWESLAAEHIAGGKSVQWEALHLMMDAYRMGMGMFPKKGQFMQAPVNASPEETLTITFKQLEAALSTHDGFGGFRTTYPPKDAAAVIWNELKERTQQLCNAPATRSRPRTGR